MRHEPSTSDEKTRFVEVFSNTYDSIHRFVQRRVPLDTVDDLVSQVYTTAWARWSRVHPPELPWLYGVARNVVRDWARQQSAASASQIADSVTASTDTSLDAISERECALSAFFSLPSDDRDLLMLVGWELLDSADAASVLGISVPTFRVRLHRARARLEAAIVSKSTTSHERTVK